MDCRACGGACCETIIVPLSSDEDTDRWVSLHGTRLDARVALDCRCSKLDTEGRCSIYDERPQLCRDFPVGSSACYDAVRARRSPEDYARIRDEWDPPVVHGKLAAVVCAFEAMEPDSLSSLVSKSVPTDRGEGE